MGLLKIKKPHPLDRIEDAAFFILSALPVLFSLFKLQPMIFPAPLNSKGHNGNREDYSNEL